MDPATPNRAVTIAADRGLPEAPVATPTAAGQAALAAAQALAKKATAPATLRAYKADWSHFADWCAAHGFVAVPAAPATVGAYLASLAASHAPTTIRRRLSALGKMHRFNDLAWNPAHRDIQGPLQGVLRTHIRPVQKAAALSVAMLRQLVATCDDSSAWERDGRSPGSERRSRTDRFNRWSSREGRRPKASARATACGWLVAVAGQGVCLRMPQLGPAGSSRPTGCTTV